MKQCVNCGRELPDGADFCPFCETEQTPPRKADAPRVWRRRTLTVCAVLAALLLACAALYAALRPKVFNADGPELAYRGYRVLLTFAMKGDPRPAELSRSSTVPSHADYAYPSQLYVYRGGGAANAREEFMERVAYVRVSTQPRDGASKMEYEEPAYNPAFPDAARVSSIFYDSTCGTNDVYWTVVMKNGDELRLRQYITVIPQPEKNYYAADHDMSTTEALRALLEEIEATETPDTLVSIYLPPVVYSGKLTLGRRAYYFYGSADAGTVTTFTDTVAVDTDSPVETVFHGVRFAGAGGTGLLASRGVIVEQCAFTGWDVGATASDGGWLTVVNCEFVGNGVGLQYNTGKSSLRSEDCGDCLFADNGVGVQFVRMPPETAFMRFSRTRFRGNGEDLRNDTHIDTDLAEAVFGP